VIRAAHLWHSPRPTGADTAQLAASPAPSGRRSLPEPGWRSSWGTGRETALNIFSGRQKTHPSVRGRSVGSSPVRPGSKGRPHQPSLLGETPSAPSLPRSDLQGGVRPGRRYLGNGRLHLRASFDRPNRNSLAQSSGVAGRGRPLRGHRDRRNPRRAAPTWRIMPWELGGWQLTVHATASFNQLGPVLAAGACQWTGAHLQARSPAAAARPCARRQRSCKAAGPGSRGGGLPSLPSPSRKRKHARWFRLTLALAARLQAECRRSGA